MKGSADADEICDGNICTNDNLIQIKSVDNDKISIFGEWQYSRQHSNDWTTTISRIPRQTIVIDDELQYYCLGFMLESLMMKRLISALDIYQTTLITIILRV